MPERSMPLSLRPATADDARRLWEVRNEPGVRSVSFNPQPIAFERHERWLRARLADAGGPIYIVRAGREDVGYVRFDSVDGEAQVIVALAPDYSGRGLGAAAL